MPPSLALFLWLICLLALLRYDPAREPETSLALWIPLIWIFITASRLPSQWLGGSVGTAEQAFEEGNSLDRTIFLVLIMLAIGVLMARSFNWSIFFARNFVLMVFLSFALVSVIWSDFPFVSLKRWIRDLGHYIVVLVALSDPRPLEAVRTLLRRLCYLLIPICILLIKYYPQLGKQYNVWTGASIFVGAAMDKNNLGVLCLVSGLFFFWDTVTRWSSRKERRAKRIIIVNIAFIAMTLWLLHYGNSATSRVCLMIGFLVVALAGSNVVRRHPALLKVLIPVGFCLSLIVVFGLGLTGELAGAVGRDPTFTDRTYLWKLLLNMHTNPFVGTGYESFWLGPRFNWIAQTFAPVNEAHNGYLEVYLNLGLIGLLLLGGFLITSYRTICRRFTTTSSLGSLSLALWTVLLFYNITEAAFKFQLMWVIFLLIAIAVPGKAEDQVHAVATSGNAGTTKRFSGPPLETTGLRWRDFARSTKR
jgi:exopolysaccharide production protein ExoQ